MANERSGNVKVSQMEAEIVEVLSKLEMGYINKRVSRQLVDGMRFLEMIKRPPYRSCKTVSELKKKISQERSKIKQRITEMDNTMPGHQFTFFEETNKISAREQELLIKVKQGLADDVKWLHKCLGICVNKDYFS